MYFKGNWRISGTKDLRGPRQSPASAGLVGKGGAAKRLSFCPPKGKTKDMELATTQPAVALRGFAVKKHRIRNRHFSLPLIRLSLLRTTRPPSTVGIIAQGGGEVNIFAPAWKTAAIPKDHGCFPGYGYINGNRLPLPKYADKIPAMGHTPCRAICYFSPSFRLIFTSIPIIQLKLHFVNE